MQPGPLSAAPKSPQFQRDRLHGAAREQIRQQGKRDALIDPEFLAPGQLTQFDAPQAQQLAVVADPVARPGQDMYRVKNHESQFFGKLHRVERRVEILIVQFQQQPGGKKEDQQAQAESHSAL